MKELVVVITISVFLTLACSPSHVYRDTADISVIADGSVPDRVELDQGWNLQTRQNFWFTSQGSRIIPYSWFIWLEQADSTERFRSVKHMESLRYLPAESSLLNPGGLPIGFALDDDESASEGWVGLTCAACHTNQIDYEDHKVLIEGAPTLANFVTFYSNLVDALDRTNQDSLKFDRFAKNVLGERYSTSAAEKLHEQLADVVFKAAQRRAVNELPADYPQDFAGYGRLDAFGNIQNAASAFALHQVSNSNPPTAPVSYPFLWGTHQSDVVQWNGSAPNTPIVGPLARNIGEVVGVFGQLSIEKAPWWARLFGRKTKYSSSVDLLALGKLEGWVKELRSPSWPDQILPPIDVAKAAEGSVVYAKKCAGCHQVIPRSEEGMDYEAKLIAVSKLGTDPAMAVNADHNTAKTLVLEGTRADILIGEKFGDTAPAISLAVNGVIGVALKDPITALEAGLISETEDKSISSEAALEESIKEYSKERALAEDPIRMKNRGLDPDLSSLVYKARPLNGIWATAPYLHNGSVPNLWELMKKPRDRAPTFWVGSREFDPLNVGYDSSSGLSEFNVYKSDGKTIQPGNSNRGHIYGTNLTDEQKWSVVEYMKTL